MENESSLIKEKFQAISSDKKNDYHSPDFASFGPSGAIESYVGYLISKHRPSKAIKVIIDCGNGAASLLAPQLFARAGFATTIINGEPNGTFPNRSPDPVAEELAYLQEEVVRQKADIGIAYDGDGDRMAIIDNAGMVLTPSQISYFILSELLKQAKGPVIANVECSLLIEDTAKAFNCKVIRVPVGHTYLMEAANANKAVFGVEFSGHYTMPQLVPFDDAMAISYWMACALASIEKALSAIVDEIPQYPFERINFSCSDSKKFDVMKKLEGEIVKKYPKTSAMDGIRVELLDGWALIRASNTEPKIRLTVEARTKEGFEKIKAQFTNILSKVM
jgi:phosphomannomutase